MLKTTFFSLFIFFIFTIFFILLKKAITYMLIPEKLNFNLLVIPIEKVPENLELILRNATFHLHEMKYPPYQKIILLDCGMEKESLLFCEIACKNFSDVSICKYNDFKKYLIKYSLQNK